MKERKLNSKFDKLLKQADSLVKTTKRTKAQEDTILREAATQAAQAQQTQVALPNKGSANKSLEVTMPQVSLSFTRREGVNSCRDEIVALRMFEADSTASARLTKIAYLKLYNRLRARTAIDLMFHAYAERGLKRSSHPKAASPTKGRYPVEDSDQLTQSAYEEKLLQNRGTQTRVKPGGTVTKNKVMVARTAHRDSKGAEEVQEIAAYGEQKPLSMADLKEKKQMLQNQIAQVSQTQPHSRVPSSSHDFNSYQGISVSPSKGNQRQASAERMQPIDPGTILERQNDSGFHSDQHISPKGNAAKAIIQLPIGRGARNAPIAQINSQKAPRVPNQSRVILTDSIAADLPPLVPPNKDTLIEGAPPMRLLDPQRVYAESLRDSARRVVLEKNVYGGTREEKPEPYSAMHIAESTGCAIGQPKPIAAPSNNRRNRAQRALYEASSAPKQKPSPHKAPATQEYVQLGEHRIPVLGADSRQSQDQAAQEYEQKEAREFNHLRYGLPTEELD